MKNSNNIELTASIYNIITDMVTVTAVVVVLRFRCALVIALAVAVMWLFVSNILLLVIYFPLFARVRVFSLGSLMLLPRSGLQVIMNTQHSELCVLY